MISGPAPPERLYRRGRDVEFDRVIFFSDAVYAIAMTLLAAGIVVPLLGEDTRSPAAMLAALRDKLPEFVSFFVGFVVLGRYWMAHHQFCALLGSVDRRLMAINLLYLAFVAFLPFPTALIGRHEGNPVSLVLYAACLAVVSGLEVLLFVHARRAGHTLWAIPDDVYRYGLRAATAPVVVFLLSIPIGFWSTTAALLSWLLMIPLGTWMRRRAPAGGGGVVGGRRRSGARPPVRVGAGGRALGAPERWGPAPGVW